MIQVKTSSGYKLPDKIFYKHGSSHIEVKKVFSNQSRLERNVLCSCELGTSQLIKSLRSTVTIYKDLIKYLTGEELAQATNYILELENEIESLKIDQLIYNQQITILDNDKHLNNSLIPATYGLNLVTEKVINSGTPQIVVKIVPGSGTFNPDVMYSPLPNNMFKFDGDYYYIGNQSDQADILTELTNSFGEGKVALQVYSSNEIITILRETVKYRADENITQLHKITVQQNLIDSYISARRAKVLVNPLLENSNTDSAVKEFYQVNSITEVLDDNLTSTSIITNTTLKIDNLTPSTKIDIKTPLFPFTIEALNTKTDAILSSSNIVKNVAISDVLSANEWTQIYNSSDIHEFKFKFMGRVLTGVHYELGNETVTALTQTLNHSRILTAKSDTVKDLSTIRKVKYHPRELNIDSSIISEVSDRILTMAESVKLSSSITNIISESADKIYNIVSPTKSIGTNVEIISEVSNKIEILPDSSKPTAQTKFIISEIGSSIYTPTLKIETDATPHTRVISLLSNKFADIQEQSLTTAHNHDRIISRISDTTHIIEDITATATAHPHLSTPETDVINEMSVKVKLESVIIPIISNIESPILSVIENVKVVNDPIPFTVYQQAVGEVTQFNSPTIEPSSIDIYVSSFKNIGSMSRISPITIIPDKVPNYISTQVNQNADLTYSDSVTSIKTIDNYVVSQVTSVYTSKVFNKPTIVAEATEIYVAESKSNNIASFGDITDYSTRTGSYIVSAKSQNVASFDDIVTLSNTEYDKVIDVKAVKPITFDNSVLVLEADQVDKVIDIKAIATISFDNSVLVLNSSAVDKVIDLKSNKAITFDNNIDMLVSNEGSPFFMSNSLLYSTSGNTVDLVIADSVDGKHYAIVRDASGIIESYETDLPITNNNYFFDEITSKMYKVTSSSGFLDMVLM